MRDVERVRREECEKELAKMMCLDRLETEKILTQDFTAEEIEQLRGYIDRMKKNLASAERS